MQVSQGDVRVFQSRLANRLAFPTSRLMQLSSWFAVQVLQVLHCSEYSARELSPSNQAGVMVTTTALKAGVFERGSSLRGTNTLASG